MSESVNINWDKNYENVRYSEILYVSRNFFHEDRTFFSSIKWNKKNITNSVNLFIRL